MQYDLSKGTNDIINLVHLLDSNMNKDTHTININTGDDFNPNFHQALELKKSDKFDSNKILEVIQTGYSLDDKLLSTLPS